MALYQIKAPDGNTYRIEGPEGATQDDVVRAVVAQHPYAGQSTEEIKKQPAAPFSVSDTAKAGLASLVGSAGSIASAFGADNAPAKYLQETASGIQQTLSPERQEEMRRRAELEERASKQGIGQEIMTGLSGVAEAPIQSVVSGVASSVPAIIAGIGAISVGAPAAIAGTVALVAKLAVGALQGAGEAKGNIYETVRDKLMAEKGMSREEAEAQASKAQEYISANAPSIMGSAAAGMLDAVTGVESVLGKKVAGKAATRPLTAPSVTGTVLKGGLEEALPEAIQGGVGKYGENVALQNAGFDVSSFSGVAGAAARDALMGALTGAAVSPRQISQLRKEHEEEKQRHLNDEKAKIDEQVAKEQEAIQQQEAAKEQEILNTPVERVKEPENLHPIRNPLGNISKEELKAEGIDPYLVEHIDEYRKVSNLPPLKSYSIEDISDAMTGSNPAEEQKQIDTILNARTGYQGEPISAKDVLDQAAAREIPTDNKAFSDFLNRTTGTDNIRSLSDSQLFAAFKAIQNVPQGQQLEEGTSSTRFTPQQYKEAIKSLDKELETAALPVDQVLSNIKLTTGLNEDLHAASILNEAVRRGDVDREGDKIAAPTTSEKLPDGYDIQEGTFKQGEKPEGYEVVFGNNVLPQLHATEEAAQKKADEITKVRGNMFKQLTNQINQQEKALQKSEENLTAMQAAGQQNTVPYQKAWAKNQKLTQTTNANIQKLNLQLEHLNPDNTPVSIRKAAARVTQKRGYTLFKGQKAVSTHKTRQEAEAKIVEDMKDEELVKISQAKGRRTLATQAKKEMERRAAPPPVQEVDPGKEFEAKFKPLLDKFGLNNVALKFIKDMKSEGEYSKSIIKIALDSANPVRVLRHESVHALKELGFFTPEQWKTLEGKAKREWINTYLKNRNINGDPLEAGQQSRYDAYMNVYKGDMDAIIEEAIADAFGDFDVNKAPPGLMSAILKRLKLFFEALQNALIGAGFQTYEDVFGKVERGELAQGEKPVETIGERLSLLREAYPDETEISTQNPQGVKRIYDPITQMLSIDEAAVREAMKANPDMAKRTIQAIKAYGFIPAGTPNNKVLEVFKKNIVNNLMFLYRNVPERIRQRSKLWYDGANKIATQMADQFDISMEQVAGVMAAMSPQKDWFQNVSMAERALDILTKHGDKAWDENMLKYARSYVKEATDRKEREKRQDAFDKITAVAEKGTKLNNMGIKEAAAFIRAYDEAYHSRNYRIVTPEGGFGDLVRNLDGKPSTMMWSTYGPIEKTVSIFRDKSRSNISQQLGFEHKIRSFYNNIAAPNSDISHVTIDTHAVAAGLFEALAGTDPEVSQNFGGTGSSDVIGVGGTYGLIADAYREAAEKAGIRAREMQSITWEAVRGLFTEEMKSSIKPKVRAEWAKYKKGEQSFDETRNKVIEIAGGFNEPDWVGSGAGLSVEEGGTSYDKDFIPEGGVRLREAKELRERLTFNLSAVTNSIPGLRELYQRAMGNDKEAYAVLQRVAESSLSYLLSGTNARLNVEYAKGVYLSDREPSISVQISFDESESQQVLAALAKFAESYNQQQIHVRQPTIRKPGYEFSDGSYATVVYQIPLKKELNNVRISEIIEQSGLAGFTVTPDTLTAYWVKEDDNAESSFDNFEKQVTKVYGLVGAKDSKTRRTTERLYVYGDGYGAQIPYEQITSDVLPKQSSDTVTPKIIAEYLTGESVTTFKQKPLTQSQVKEQEQLADVFDELPLNDLKRPLVKKAYQALAKELKKQFAVLPIKVELINSTSEPYANSAEMREDVSKNNRFRVYKTMPDTFGPPGSNFRGHPLLQDSGLTDINGEPMLYNDLLRAVHDYFAHNLSETEFGPRGEAAAWRNHMATTNDPMARWALTVETRAQNAWQNFRRGAQDLTLMQRGFADQKASLPPVNFVLTGNQKIDQPMVDFISTLTPEEKLGSLSPDSALAKKVMAKMPTKKLSLRDTALDLETLLAEYSRPAKSIEDADRALGKGDRVFIMHEMADDVTEISSAGQLKGYTADQVVIVPANINFSPDIRYSLRETPEFKQWFGDSKIVDEQGNPLVVYHGTNADISAFWNDYAGSNTLNYGMYGKAPGYFSKNANEATGYAVGNPNRTVFESKSRGINQTTRPNFIETPTGKIKEGANVMPVYISIKKPLEVDSHTALDNFIRKIARTGKLGANSITAALKALGYDGVVVDKGAEIVPFSSTQIKSAIGNVGTFDRKNPDIRYSLRDTPQFKQWFGNSKIVNSDGTPKVMYHGTAQDISEFKPKQAGAIFVTDDPKFAGSFALNSENFMAQKVLDSLSLEDRQQITKQAEKIAKKKGTFAGDEIRGVLMERLPSRANIIPVYVSAQNPFDYENPQHVDKVQKSFEYTGDKYFDNSVKRLEEGDWGDIESKLVQKAIRKAGFDGFFVKEGGQKNLAVYKPEQIKSATGNVGTFDKYNPDIRYDLRNSTDPAIMAAVDTVTTAREEKGFVERMMEAIAPKSFSEFRAQALNRYNRLGEYDKKLAEKMGGAALFADVSAESAALFSDLGAGLTASALGVHDRNGGIPVYKNGVTTVTNLNGTVKGPVAIFAPLAKYGDPTIYQLYQFWAGAKRGKRLLADGREETYSPAMLAHAKKLEQNHPEFVQIQKDWIQFNNGLVQFLVDTGVLSKEKADEFTRYSDYIPFYRQMDGENTIGPNIFQAISGVKSPKKLKGSEAPLADFLETVVRNTQSSIQMGIKNVASQRAANVATKINMAQRLNHVASGVDVFVVMEKGKQVYYRSADPLFINAIKSLNLPDLPFIGLLAAPANLLRNLVTKDPGFMLANMVRDSMSAYLTSGAKMTPIASTVSNFGKAIAGTSPEFNALLNAGLLGGYEFSSNVEQSGKTMQEALRIKAGMKTNMDKAKGVWQLLEKGTTASDAATRMEIYKSTMAETGNEAEALFRAMEVMNFNRKGSSAVVRLLTAAVPFLNARMQGLDVLYRTAFGQNATANAKEMQRAFFVRGMTMFGMSCMYWALTHDDDDYKSQEQETKDNYWLIPALGIKIPTPFEVAIPFKVIPERIMALAFGTDTAKDFTDSMTRQLVNTLAFNPIPQTALPFVEVVTNHSFFTGRDIIGQGMQDIAPEFQIGPNTSLAAQKIGSALGMSPMKLDHLIKGFTGTMGMYAVDVIDGVLDLNNNSPKVSKRFEQYPIIKRFAIDPEARGAVTAYYDLKNSVDETTRTINLLERTGNFEAMGEYYKDNMNLLATKDYVSDLEKDMKQIREMKVMVRSSSMSGDDKRDALVSLNRMENQLTANIQDIRKFALK